MLILVNPTYRNLSSKPEYKGKKFPFIGIRQFWKVLADGELIDKKVAYSLPTRDKWNDSHAKQIQNELLKNKLFLTNVVKCCYNHSLYPENRVIAEQLKLLAEEIEIIKPKKIVAFGGLVYKMLTSRSIKLVKYYNEEKKDDIEIILGLNIPVVPCYFPTGRGNPAKAAEVIRKFFSSVGSGLLT